MIRIENLTKVFKGARVLDALSLEIATGSRVALIGSNGAGKTTLIRCLLGEYAHDGSVLIDDRSPRAQRAEVLKGVGFVPQMPPPLKMPVGELLRFTAQVTGADPKRFEIVAGRLGLTLEPIRNRPFVKLSGGMKQKLLISIALGRDVGLLIMDEPAANLDPPARKALFALLAEMPRTTMLITSHRLDEVAPLVDRVIELDGGRVALDDTVADALDRAAVLACRLAVSRREDAFARAMHEWGFRDADTGLVWEGEVPGPDRLRFLGTLSRYSGLITAVNLEEPRV
ncbi:ABC transporter ATP-binding protein [Azospirillum sp. TSO22-1]|uniref:ABC transporter ATP-binding protein n=1 Tax=Azospirillum sp. TSO22-1 TaxID=716789 RepID=UPI000D61FF07|nr:ABC transporter ATP-binding protein [Azospirillum sp. TSO22-1]PWC38268.1 ABC transporter [Azospirillum sp. TSO22-1]